MAAKNARTTTTSDTRIPAVAEPLFHPLETSLLTAGSNASAINNETNNKMRKLLRRWKV
jgi:hypothetical protein